MQKLLRFLNPHVLKKLDRYLLLHFPRLWATRFHYVLLYGLLANLFGALIMWLTIQPNQIAGFNSTFIWIIILVEAAAFIFWLNTQALFNVELEYGKTHYSVGILEAIVYTICTASIFSTAMVMLVTGVYKLDRVIRLSPDGCFGSLSWQFLSSSDLVNLSSSRRYDIEKLQAVFNLARQAVASGQAADLILVELAAVQQDFLSPFLEYYGQGNAISMVTGKEIRIHSGEAEIRSRIEGVAIKSGDSIIRIEPGDRVNISEGDEMFYEPLSVGNQEPAMIDIITGRLETSTHYEKHIAEGGAMIVEDNHEIKLVKGETIVETNSEIVPYSRLFSDIYYYGSGINICQSIADFVHQRDTYTDYSLGIYRTAFFVLILTVLGLLLVTPLKHSNWRILIVTFVYILISSILLIFLAAIFESFVSTDFVDWEQYGIDSYNGILLVALTAFVLFTIIQSATLIRTRKYRPFAFINFVSLPIAIAVLVVMTALIKNDWDYDDYIRALSIFFLIYVLLSPIQKKLLVHLITLPRE